MSTTRLISLPFYCCLIIIIFLLLIDIVNGRWCYWIDGTDAKDRNPCLDLNTVGASMCCDGALAASFVKCIGGICVYNFSSGIPGLYDDGRSFWRDSCTDPRWQDPACLAMAPYIKSSETRLSICGDGSFCPRTLKDPNMTCCDNHQGQFASNSGAQLIPDSTSSTQTLPLTSLSSPSFSPSSFTSSTLSLSSSTLSNVLPSETSTKAVPESGSLSTAVQIATILGSVFGSLSLIAAVIFGIRAWKTRHPTDDKREETRVAITDQSEGRPIEMERLI